MRIAYYILVYENVYKPYKICILHTYLGALLKGYYDFLDGLSRNPSPLLEQESPSSS